MKRSLKELSKYTIETKDGKKGLVKINFKTDTIKNAPVYNPTDFIDVKYEKGLSDYSSRSLIK